MFGSLFPSMVENQQILSTLLKNGNILDCQRLKEIKKHSSQKVVNISHPLTQTPTSTLPPPKKNRAKNPPPKRTSWRFQPEPKNYVKLGIVYQGLFSEISQVFEVSPPSWYI